MGFDEACIKLSVLPVLASEWLMGNSYRPESMSYLSSNLNNMDFDEVRLLTEA